MQDFDFKKFEELAKKEKIEEIVKDLDWRTFEKIVANIFEKNGFKTKTNFILKTSKRFEIDVLAVSDLYVFCVDCKEWGKGRQKTSALKNAAMKQEERMKELKKFLKRNSIASKLMKIGSSQEFFSLIVTWHEENLIKEDETFIVPLWKLNAFIGNFENYR